MEMHKKMKYSTFQNVVRIELMEIRSFRLSAEFSDMEEFLGFGEYFSNDES